MNPVPKGSCNSSGDRIFPCTARVPGCFLWLSLCALLCGFPARAWSQQPPVAPAADSASPGARETAASPAAPSPAQQVPGSISGTLVDPSGAAAAGARVTLTRDDSSPALEARSNDDGEFSFPGISPGPFHLAVTLPGFSTHTVSGTVHPGESYVVPQISLAVATSVTEMQVVLTRVDVAEAEIHEEEKQRVLGFIPNFYVSYVPNAEPLTTRQKFELAWKTTVDPVTFGITGAVAGIQQAEDNFGGYGQGAQGFGKRYGAAYADLATNTFLSGAIFPALLKQDPRYFYKGTGSVGARILYAMAHSVRCKGDNGHWEPNYSNFLGSLASGGISNLYYPDSRTGAALTFENAAIGIASGAAVNVLQEFVMRKFTSHVPSQNPRQP